MPVPSGSLADLLVQATKSGSPRTFLDLLGARIGDMDEGKVSLTLEVRDELCRVGGILHGGATATLLDSLCGLAGATVVDGKSDLVTAQLNIHFVRPAVPGEVLTGQGLVEHRGKRTLVCRGEIHRPGGELLAMGTATMMVLESRLKP